MLHDASMNLHCDVFEREVFHNKKKEECAVIRNKTHTHWSLSFYLRCFSTSIIQVVLNSVEYRHATKEISFVYCILGPMNQFFFLALHLNLSSLT